jgi:hypothetical protein
VRVAKSTAQDRVVRATPLELRTYVPTPASACQWMSGAAPAAAAAHRQLSAGSILEAVGGLDDLKENMQRRRTSAVSEAKALPRGGAGAAAGVSGRARSVSLAWHGTKSFLEQRRGV